MLHWKHYHYSKSSSLELGWPMVLRLGFDMGGLKVETNIALVVREGARSGTTWIFIVAQDINRHNIKNLQIVGIQLSIQVKLIQCSFQKARSSSEASTCQRGQRHQYTWLRFFFDLFGLFTMIDQCITTLTFISIVYEYLYLAQLLFKKFAFENDI